VKIRIAKRNKKQFLTVGLREASASVVCKVCYLHQKRKAH